MNINKKLRKMEDKSKDLLFSELLYKSKSTSSLGINTGKNIYNKLTPNTYISTAITSKIIF